jgi:phasin family protein
VATKKPAAKPVAKAAPKPVAKAPVAKPPVAKAPVAAAPPKPILVSVPTFFNVSTKENIMATAFETNPEKIAETIKASVSQFSTSAESAMTSGKAAMEQISAKSKEAVEGSMKSVEEMTETARGNVEAMMASAKLASTGLESIATHIGEMTKKSFEEAQAVAKSMAAVKSPNELMQIQNDFAKAQYESIVAEMSKMTEMMMKLSGEIMEPVQNRVAITTDKLKTTFTK